MPRGEHAHEYQISLHSRLCRQAPNSIAGTEFRPSFGDFCYWEWNEKKNCFYANVYFCGKEKKEILDWAFSEPRSISFILLFSIEIILSQWLIEWINLKAKHFGDKLYANYLQLLIYDPLIFQSRMSYKVSKHQEQQKILKSLIMIYSV